MFLAPALSIMFTAAVIIVLSSALQDAKRRLAAAQTSV